MSFPYTLFLLHMNTESTRLPCPETHPNHHPFLIPLNPQHSSYAQLFYTKTYHKTTEKPLLISLS